MTIDKFRKGYSLACSIGQIERLLEDECKHLKLTIPDVLYEGAYLPKEAENLMQECEDHTRNAILIYLYYRLDELKAQLDAI